MYSIKRKGKCSWILVVEAGVLAVEQRVVALAVQGVEAVSPGGGGGGGAVGGGRGHGPALQLARGLVQVDVAHVD